jgi:branched-chain amino acid transport system permease protein
LSLRWAARPGCVSRFRHPLCFLALGLNIVVGFAGLLDLGYIAFYAVGAYTWALLASPHFGLHLPIWAILPIGGPLAAWPAWCSVRRRLKLRGDYLAIVTLGFGEIVRIFMNNLNAPINITNGPQGITLIDPVAFGGFKFSGTRRFSADPERADEVLLPAGGVGHPGHHHQPAPAAFAHRSRLAGHSRRRIAAKAIGINTRNIKLLAFAMGASFGGIAGGVFAAMQGFVSPESFSLMESIMILAMVVLGGMGHIPGSSSAPCCCHPAGSAALRRRAAQMAVFGKMLVDPESLRMLVFGLALVLVMRFKPAGLWPSPERKRELSEAAK